MHRRPLLLKLVIAFLTLAPIGMIGVLLYYDKNFYHDLGWQLNAQIGLFCLSSFAAAYGVFRARSYGFWMFIAFVAGCALVDLSDVIAHPEQRNLGHLVDLVCSVIGLAIIFRKKNRQLFFDKAMRWWERSTRFVVEWPAKITFGGASQEVQVQSISHSGCFLATHQNIPLHSEFQVELRLNDQLQSFKVQAVRVSHQPAGVGCTFMHKDQRADQELKRVLKEMSKRSPQLAGKVA